MLRYLQQAGIDGLEVTTPDRTDRRKSGKNDMLDAENAAHRTVTPQTRDGLIDSLHVLKTNRPEDRNRGAPRRAADDPDEHPRRAGETARILTVHDANAMYPEAGRLEPRSDRLSRCHHSLPDHTHVAGTPLSQLDDEIADYKAMIKSLVDELAPKLIERQAVGYTSAAQWLFTADDKPERLYSESSLAALCGVSPIPASSGKIHRHRLNWVGNRVANRALQIIAIGRLRTEA